MFTFDRESMFPMESVTGPRRAEGYFLEPHQKAGPSSPPKKWKSGTTLNPDIRQWLQLLDVLETRLWNIRHAMMPDYQCQEYPNPSWCRICKKNQDVDGRGIMSAVPDLGNLPPDERRWYVEYRVRHANVLYLWPGGTRHYYEQHFCLPSMEFYNLVNRFGIFAAKERF